jgi:uncharacterized protein YkwD
MPSTPRNWLAAALLGCVLLLGLGLLSPGQSSAARHSTAAPVRSAALEGSLLHLLNQQRAKRGLRALRRSTALDRAAGWQSRDMVNRRYFDHKRPGGPSLSQRIRRSGYLSGARGWSLGENIAWGEGSYSTPRSLVSAWMESSGHRANILRRRYEHIGIGIASGTPEGRGGGEAVTVTTDFGARR